MSFYLVDNRAGILSNEKSVLDVFQERIERAIRNEESISFHIAVGFFFFRGVSKAMSPSEAASCQRSSKQP